MSKEREALKLALKALEKMGRVMKQSPDTEKAIVAIRKALAEQPAQQQEPVARSKAYDMIDRFLRNNLNSDDDYAEYSTALDSLYTSPPASKPWVGLTQQDIDIAFDDTQEGGGFDEFARAIEAKLREKNAQPSKPLTDEQITAGARALCKQMAESCGVDARDQWQLYADTFKEDAKAVLEAAHAKGDA